MSSAAQPLERAIRDALRDDGQLSALLSGGKVYETKAPDGSPFSYITVGSLSEQPDDCFDADGNVDTVTLHIWTRKPDERPNKKYALAIYGHVNRILHNTQLALSGGFYHVNGTLSLVDVILDPSDPDLKTMHGIATYRALSEVAA